MEDRGDEGIRKDVDDQLPWRIWVTDPLSKDADVLVRWSRTSFFAGCPVSKPHIIDGKEFALYLKCSDEEFALSRSEQACKYYGDVRLHKHGAEVKRFRSNSTSTDADDMLGGSSGLTYKGGMC